MPTSTFQMQKDILDNKHVLLYLHAFFSFGSINGRTKKKPEVLTELHIRTNQKKKNKQYCLSDLDLLKTSSDLLLFRFT